MNNKKILIYGSVAAIILVVIVSILFFRLFSGPHKEAAKEFDKDLISVFAGVPSDAVMVFDFKRLGNFAPMLQDTSSFAIMLLDDKNPLVSFQKQLVSFKEVEDIPFVYSLHYSAKNSVSFLQVIDLSRFDRAAEVFEKLQTHASATKRRYNSAYIYSYPSGLNLSFHKNLILASNSSYVLESSIRHIENGTSILDNREFSKLIVGNGMNECLYLNHKQIGKLFSGEVDREFLKYSDFFLQLSSWSVMDFIQKPGVLQLKGNFLNNREEANFSTIFYGQPKQKSQMGKILPAKTVLAVSLQFPDVKEYMAAYKLFLEVQKKLGRYNASQQSVRQGKELSPAAWIESMRVEEIVSAYCRFGEKCEWMTFIREKSSFGFNDMIASVVDKRKPVRAEPFQYKGYMGSLFGGVFASCNEEFICKIGDWNVIGPRKMVDEFISGNANYFSLEDFLGQTPASGFLGRESSAKIAVNVKEAGDSVLRIFKPYLRGLLGASLKKNNFEYLTTDIFPGESGKVEIELSFYATRLKELPEPRVKPDGKGDMRFEVDSTIVLPKGPFEVKDVAKRSKAYLEQLPNMRLRYLDGNKKGVWAIPFETPLCGAVEQADLFKNGKLQMVFVSGDKLYALDRLGRFVRGYPVKLPEKVALGPAVLDIKGNREYTVMTLNTDNTLSWYDIKGNRLEGWKDIKAPEFIKELPRFREIGGKRYWVLKTPSRLRIYTSGGKEIMIQDKKKIIDRESAVRPVAGNEVKVKGTDGKEFILDLITGKTKKVK